MARSTAQAPALSAFLVDAAERVFFTFVATFVALYTPVIFSVTTGLNWHALVSLSLLQKAAVAGVAAAFTVVKSYAATFVGDVNSPGFVPNWVRNLFNLAEKV